MYRGGWWAIVREVTESQTQLSKKEKNKTNQHQTTPLLCTSSVTLGKLLYLFDFQFSHLKNGGNNNTY